MQKIDIAIGIMGAVALTATLLGVLLYEDGTQTYTFTVVDESVSAGPGAVDGSAEFTFPVPNNTVGVTLEVTILCEQVQAFAGGDGDASVEVQGPDGSVSEPVTEGFSFGPGASDCDDGSAVTVSVEHNWTSPPQMGEYTEEELQGLEMTWDDVIVRVTVTPPDDPGSTLPGGQVQYNFGANIDGTAQVWQPVLTTPDVESR